MSLGAIDSLQLYFGRMSARIERDLVMLKETHPAKQSGDRQSMGKGGLDAEHIRPKPKLNWMDPYVLGSTNASSRFLSATLYLYSDARSN